MGPAGGDKQWVRIARFLSRGEAVPAGGADGGKILLDGGDRGTISAPRTALEAMARSGLVERVAGKLSLSQTGAAYLKRALAVFTASASRAAVASKSGVGSGVSVAGNRVGIGVGVFGPLVLAGTMGCVAFSGAAAGAQPLINRAIMRTKRYDFTVFLQLYAGEQVIKAPGYSSLG